MEQPEGEIESSSQHVQLRKVYRKSKAITGWDDRQTAFIFRPESSLGTEWVALLNGHTVHFTYDYFTYRHDRVRGAILLIPPLNAYKHYMIQR